MANWLNDPAVKALLPHIELLEEALGVTEIEKKPLGRQERGSRRKAPRDLATRRLRRRKPPLRFVKPAA